MYVKLSDLFSNEQRMQENKDPVMYHPAGSSIYDIEKYNKNEEKQPLKPTTLGDKNVIPNFKKHIKQSLNLINSPKSNLYGHTPVISWSQQNFFKQTHRSYNQKVNTENNKANPESNRANNEMIMMQTGFSNLPTSQRSQRQRILIDADPLKKAQKVLQDRKIDSADWANLKDGIEEQLIRKAHTIQPYNTQSSISLNLRKSISMKDRMKTMHDQYYKMHLVFGDSFNSLNNENRREDTIPTSNSILQKQTTGTFQKHYTNKDFNFQKTSRTNQTDELLLFEKDSITQSPKKFRHQMISSICMAQIKPVKGGKVKQSEKEKFQNYYDSVSERLQSIKQTRNLNKFNMGQYEFNWQQIKYNPVSEGENKSLKEVRDFYLRERIASTQNQIELILSNREKEEVKKKQKITQQQEDKYVEEYKKKTFFLFKNLEEESEIQKSKEKQRKLNHIDDSIDYDKLLSGLQISDQHENHEKFKIIRKQLREYLLKHYTLGISIKEAMINSIFKREPFVRQHSEDFFIAVKSNDLEKVKDYLSKDQYLVYQFDTTLQTPLHWAAKRGYLKLAEILVEYNCDIDSRDQIGRTPLYFAYREGFNDMGKLLLLKKASPWSNKRNKIDAAVYSRDTNDKTTIKIAKQIHLMMMMAKFQQKQKIWDNTKYLFEDKFFNKEVKTL